MTLASWRLALMLLLSAACSTFPKLDLSTLPKPTDFPEAKYLWLLDEQAGDAHRQGSPASRQIASVGAAWFIV